MQNFTPMNQPSICLNKIRFFTNERYYPKRQSFNVIQIFLRVKDRPLILPGTRATGFAAGQLGPVSTIRFRGAYSGRTSSSTSFQIFLGQDNVQRKRQMRRTMKEPALPRMKFTFWFKCLAAKRIYREPADREASFSHRFLPSKPHEKDRREKAKEREKEKRK